MRRFLIIPVFVLLVSLTSFLVKPSVLEVGGYILRKGEKVEGATAVLYQNNQVVNKLISKANGKFIFVLFSNNEYVIEISKEDAVTERIYLSTINEGDLLPKYRFDFAVELKDIKEFEGVDMSALDFPTAVIKYDDRKDEYVHDKVYSKNVKEEIRKLKESANK